MYKLSVESEFSAAHKLVKYPGACHRIHGHNWRVRVRVTAEKLDNLGMAVDLMMLKGLLDECLQQFDHQMINEIAPFDQINPSSENLAKYFFEWLEKRLPPVVTLEQVTLSETAQFSVTYTGSLK